MLFYKLLIYWFIVLEKKKIDIKKNPIQNDFTRNISRSCHIPGVIKELILVVLSFILKNVGFFYYSALPQSQSFLVS